MDTRFISSSEVKIHMFFINAEATNWIYILASCHIHARIQRGRLGNRGSRPPPPLKNHKNIGFLSNTDPYHLKNHKAAKQDSMLGRHRHAVETPFKWCFPGGPLIVVIQKRFL